MPTTKTEQSQQEERGHLKPRPTTMKFLGEIILLMLLLTALDDGRHTCAAFSFVPSTLHHACRPAAAFNSRRKNHVMLAAEAKNASEISHDNLVEYRDNLSMISRSNGDRSDGNEVRLFMI